MLTFQEVSEKADHLKRIIFDSSYRFSSFGSRGFYNHLSDEEYLKRMYKARMGYELDLNNPRTFNEKLQWLKLYDRNPIYTTMVDKYAVKSYVASIIGEQFIIPTLGVWDSFEDIAFDSLPNQFVLKCTHDSGGLVIVKDKSRLNLKAAREKINRSLKRNYFYFGREWPYKCVKPRILAEEYLEDQATSELRDYKFFCFNGEAKALFVASDRQNPTTDTKFDFFDMQFHHLNFTNGHPNSEKVISKPATFDKMKCLAEALSKDIPHVRVDFYDVDGRVYFGELTFSHWSGFVPFDPPEWDKTFGDWIILPQ